MGKGRQIPPARLATARDSDAVFFDAATIARKVIDAHNVLTQHANDGSSERAAIAARIASGPNMRPSDNLCLPVAVLTMHLLRCSGYNAAINVGNRQTIHTDAAGVSYVSDFTPLCYESGMFHAWAVVDCPNGPIGVDPLLGVERRVIAANGGGPSTLPDVWVGTPAQAISVHRVAYQADEALTYRAMAAVPSILARLRRAELPAAARAWRERRAD